MHLATLVTSRVEGNHALLKRQMHSGKRATIDEVIHACGVHIQHQYSAVEYQDKRESARIPTWVSTDKFFNAVKGRISSTALEKIRSMVDQARLGTVTGSCTGVFRRTMGLPCSHDCLKAMTSTGELSVEEFAPRWQIGKLSGCTPTTGGLYPKAPQLAAKRTAQGSIMSHGVSKKRGIASTGRILSSFERETFPEQPLSIQT